ncbi:ankyrin repeat and zinc finger domain-containing protein 1 [Cucumis melo var. makuwa]|uniref:Ankyrin repeat and zinc finger domain-containing protein 1 n=1 Tax=Cucumis melo var. makuwa TaxID=1194695 RepID=A0A5A7U602_CUCMM|nr:ankyrin repeat and zinc finger domain-containing protein 1 [Cucumis melo var. makuwa]
METNPAASAVIVSNTPAIPPEKRNRSIFDVPADFFDSCKLLRSPHSYTSPTSGSNRDSPSAENTVDSEQNSRDFKESSVAHRWTCNICKAEFESLLDQRSHFKSDIHRFNVKLSIAGKNIVKEDDFDELTSDYFRDFDVSSISGSEDETEKERNSRNEGYKGTSDNVNKKRLFVHLQTGERASVWKCLIINESDNILYEEDKTSASGSGVHAQCLRESDVVARLKYLNHEPRDGSHLRIVLLASGGHFAGCVFDGNSVVAHKTFHRYVVRAKSGKKQSSKDASGKSISSAGASLRRHNELALKKEIQDLLAAWKSYFNASSCVYIYAPSNNRQLLFNGDKPYFSDQHSAIRNIPLTVRRPTLKEARRIYEQLVQVVYEVDEKEILSTSEHNALLSATADIAENGTQDISGQKVIGDFEKDACTHLEESVEHPKSSDSESEVICRTTPLHEASQSGNADRVLELLEQGFDPCIKDERGRTPYMLASEKEVRNNFRRFMASNLDKWDWDAAKVPSALTKEMEESQAAKQAEKDAKRKARAKELKKLKKEKAKKAQAAQDAEAQKAAKTEQSRGIGSILNSRAESTSGKLITKEELQMALAAEREKRAAAAERRMAAMAAAAATNNSSSTTSNNSSQTKSGSAGDANCSCCGTSLAGKVPFHRYNYKYCSSTCMHVHKEVLDEN